MSYDVEGYAWFMDDELVRIVGNGSQCDTFRVYFPTEDKIWQVNGSDLTPVVHTYRDKDGGFWELNLNDGLYYVRRQREEDTIPPEGFSLVAVRKIFGPLADANQDQGPKIGSYLKPKDAVYQILGYDLRDQTAEVKDVDTGQVHTILMEFYEETKPPLPKVGQVWTRNIDGDVVAYTVARHLGEYTLEMKSAFTELTVAAEELLRDSSEWVRIF